MTAGVGRVRGALRAQRRGAAAPLPNRVAGSLFETNFLQIFE
jgi:hypothetical protein